MRDNMMQQIWGVAMAASTEVVGMLLTVSLLVLTAVADPAPQVILTVCQSSTVD